MVYMSVGTFGSPFFRPLVRTPQRRVCRKSCRWRLPDTEQHGAQQQIRAVLKFQSQRASTDAADKTPQCPHLFNTTEYKGCTSRISCTDPSLRFRSGPL